MTREVIGPYSNVMPRYFRVWPLGSPRVCFQACVVSKYQTALVSAKLTISPHGINATLCCHLANEYEKLAAKKALSTQENTQPDSWATE